MITPISDADRAWIASLLDELAERNVPLELPALERYYDAMQRDWAGRPAGQRWDPTQFVARVGAGFGAVLARRTGLDWYVVTADGKDSLALSGGRADFVVYPLAVVAKRWRAGQTGFLVALGEEFDEEARRFLARADARADGRAGA